MGHLGFSNADYLKELGAKAQSEVYKQSSLDTAMRDCFRKARRFLMTVRGLSEDEAIALLSVGVDFSQPGGQWQLGRARGDPQGPLRLGLMAGRNGERKGAPCLAITGQAGLFLFGIGQGIGPQ
jgi:hypothetical protein